MNQFCNYQIKIRKLVLVVATFNLTICQGKKTKTKIVIIFSIQIITYVSIHSNKIMFLLIMYFIFLSINHENNCSINLFYELYKFLYC